MAGDDNRLLCGRRKFIQDGARYAALSFIGAIVAFLGFNARRNSGTCERRFVCGACPRLARCELPAAQKKRNTNQEVGV